MKNFRTATIVTIVGTIVAVGASFLVPVPKGTGAVYFYANLGLSLATLVLYAGGSVVITQGFGAFTGKLRRSYTIIFIGLTLWGLSFAALPILTATGQINNAIYSSLIAVPFIGSGLFIFAGTRMLAKLFNVRSIALHWWFAIGLIVVIGAVVSLLPHAPSLAAEIDFDATNALSVLAVTFIGLGAYHILLVKRQASVTFMNALAWLCLSMAITFLGSGFGSITSVMVFGAAGDQLTLFSALIPSCISAAMFLRSAYSFNKIVESSDTQALSVARNFFGKPLVAKQQGVVTSIDIVVYVANLVSNRKDVEPALDKMRTITANMQVGATLTAGDQQTLQTLYLDLEHYLLEKEQVRRFTIDAIRQDVAQKLRLTDTSGQQTFWPSLPPIGPAAAPVAPVAPVAAA